RKGLLSFASLDWPYTEGLRLDEAMHPLALLTVGLYGQVLPNPNGAPIRVVVPWKYGFKSAKSIVRVSLVDHEPKTAWDTAAPQEYGFYSNVNPNVDHPRWSQATERRIGEFRRRKTLIFNGYADQVASLYTGMDLKKYYYGRGQARTDSAEGPRVGSVSHAARPARLSHGDRRPRREPHQLRDELARRLDAATAAGEPRDDAAAAPVRPVVAARVPAAAGTVRVLLCDATLLRLARPRSLLR